MSNPNPAPGPKPKTGLVWRPMMPGDLQGLIYVGEVVHPSLPESPSLFTERARLFPDGCLVLTDSDPDPFSSSETEPRMIYGYGISHPISYNSPPQLDSLLYSVPDDPVASDKGDDKEDNKSSQPQYYIHDVAILPEMRGHGLAGICVRQLLDVAREHGYKTTVLISVYGTSEFWGRYGFKPPEELAEALREKIKGYGDDAVYLIRKEG